MTTDISRRSEVFTAEDRLWLASAHGTEATRTVTLDPALFTQATHFPLGYVPSGMTLGRVTATGLYGPYGGTSDEAQTVTIGGSGLTSYTLTFTGQTTTAIAPDATAAVVQAALVALSNIGPGDVVVTGAAGGPYTLTFAGALADTNVAALTSTPTGGTGTVTIATTTAGGADSASDGRETMAGHLFNTTKMTATTGPKVGAPLLEHGIVRESMLPAGHGLDANGKADVAGRLHYR